MDRKQTVSLEMVLMGIKPIDEEAVKAAKAHWDRVAKPLNTRLMQDFASWGQEFGRWKHH